VCGILSGAAALLSHQRSFAKSKVVVSNRKEILEREKACSYGNRKDFAASLLVGCQD